MRRSRSVFNWLIWLALILVILFGVLNFRALADWWALRGYTPPANIAQIANEDTMTPKAEHIFYVNHPDLTSDVNNFRQHCPTYEQTIVLGCYRSNQNGIFIFNVNDIRLNGVQEVTAAHEMLHGAYDRLNKKDKEHIDNLLTNYFANDLHDQRIIDTINSYKQTEPNDVINEMHSVFGSEVTNLTPELETYYRQYFSNRSTVVGFANNYEGEFSSRVSKIKDYEKQLAFLQQTIKDEESALNSQLNKIESDRRRLDSLKNSGQFATYNSAVPAFNAEVDAYNSAVAKLKSDISMYNDLVGVHNQLAAELRSLYSSLDTSLTPQMAQ